jgi:hypothetical protein
MSKNSNLQNAFTSLQSLDVLEQQQEELLNEIKALTEEKDLLKEADKLRKEAKALNMLCDACWLVPTILVGVLGLWIVVTPHSTENAYEECTWVNGVRTNTDSGTDVCK